jgi:hypothetical protein
MTGFGGTILLCLAAFLAVTTQAATDFGFVLLFSPLLILALDPVTAVQVMIVVNLPISLIVLPGWAVQRIRGRFCAWP